MNGRVYYNEIDEFAVAWLAELMRDGLIPDGVIDTRSIVDVQPGDLRGFIQCHFFAGIAGWPLALDLAGWPRDRPVWTGSCPCPPFSVASVGHGGAKGQDDNRDFWPCFGAHIAEQKPPTVFGEQVASSVGWGWWDRAALDLEKAGYAVGASILRADAIGARHQRKRLFFVAHAGGKGWQGHQSLERISVSAQASLSINGDPIAGARRALDGDYGNLLPCDGLSVQLERLAVKGFGNAIVPQAAAEFIKATM